MWLADRVTEAQMVTDRSILVVEDDEDLANLVALNLRDAGHRVVVEHNGRVALEMTEAESFDLVVLDLTLPGLDGLEICRQLRSRSSYTAILMLTARTTELDRVLGLEMGADDYLTKPFSVRELVARVKALLRRMEAFAAGETEPATRRPTAIRFDWRSLRPTSAVRLGGQPRRPDREGVRPARVLRPPPGSGLHPRTAARPGVGLCA